MLTTAISALLSDIAKSPFQPGLQGWPFLGQISEIWPRFKLIGLKNFSWLFFGFISSWLALKNLLGPLAPF